MKHKGKFIHHSGHMGGTEYNDWLRSVVDGEQAEQEVLTPETVFKEHKSVSKVEKYESKGTYTRCAHSHPPLSITTPEGQTVQVHGGACGDPVHDHLDIYVALDWSTSHDPQAYPWHGTRQFVHFPIKDMSTPGNAEEFKRMIGWLAEQLRAGKSLHVGCLGGHGRTGMVLAALVKTLGGIEDAVTYVREHYCKKAVETSGQVKWLAHHFGIKEVGGAKEYSSHTYRSSGWGSTLTKERDGRVSGLVEQYSDRAEKVQPLRTKGNIWGLLTSAINVV